MLLNDKEAGEDDFLMADELTLKDPFVYGEWAIRIDMQKTANDYRILKQFCVSKGIYPEWYKNNPFMK